MIVHATQKLGGVSRGSFEGGIHESWGIGKRCLDATIWNVELIEEAGCIKEHDQEHDQCLF
jgi:hypothetical protein